MSNLSPILSLPLLQAAQAQKHVTHNEALRLLDVLVQPAVASRQTTTPPALPVEGERFILPGGAGGAWAGHAGAIAFFEQDAWGFVPPQPGWQAHVLDEGTTATWTGSAWVTPAEQPAEFPQLGVGTAADSTNRLTVASPATLLTHAGAGHQLKLNKAAAGDTASLLFQTGWSGRAEMGTAGSDGFAIKVSADGSTWATALQANAGSGRIQLPRGASLPDGTALAPALAFEGDADTGLLHPGADQIALATGGVQRALLSSTGLQLDVALGGTAVQPTAGTGVNTTLPDTRLVRMDGAKTAMLSRGGGGHHANTGINIDTLLPGAQGLYRSGINTGTFPPFLSPTSSYWMITTEAIYSPSPGTGHSIRQTAVGYRYDTSTADAVVICERIMALQDGHWSSWVRLYHNRNIVGTTSQTGGMPTGAIVERGSNANGDYTRFADGTQICWRATAITTNPATFTGTPVGIDGDKLRIGRWY